MKTECFEFAWGTPFQARDLRGGYSVLLTYAYTPEGEIRYGTLTVQPPAGESLPEEMVLHRKSEPEDPGDEIPLDPSGGGFTLEGVEGCRYSLCLEYRRMERDTAIPPAFTGVFSPLPLAAEGVPDRTEGSLLAEFRSENGSIRIQLRRGEGGARRLTVVSDRPGVEAIRLATEGNEATILLYPVGNQLYGEIDLQDLVAEATGDTLTIRAEPLESLESLGRRELDAALRINPLFCARMREQEPETGG